MPGTKRKMTTQRGRPLKRRRLSKSTAALRIAKRALRQNRPEVKIFDSSQQSLQMLKSGTRFSLIGDNSTEFQAGQDIVQGTGDDHRVGDKIRSKSMYLKYRVWIPATSALTASQMVRVAVIKFKMPNGKSLSVTDVYNDLATDPMIARRNTEKSDMFTILHDRVHRLKKDQNSQDILVKKYIKLNEEVVFDGSSQLINKNAYFLAFWSDIPSGTDTPKLSLNFRYAFTDA